MAKKHEAAKDGGGSASGEDQLSGLPSGANPKKRNLLRFYFWENETEARPRRVSAVLRKEETRKGSTGTAESAGVP